MNMLTPDALNFGAYSNPSQIMMTSNPTVAAPSGYGPSYGYGAGGNGLMQNPNANGNGGAMPSGLGAILAAMGNGASTAGGFLGRGMPGAGGGFFGSSGGKLGLNMDTAGLAMSGLQTLANVWGAFEARNLAKKQFNFTKDVTNTNLANQIASYNTAISDRARSRGKVEGQTSAETQAYVDKNSLAPRKI